MTEEPYAYCGEPKESIVGNSQNPNVPSIATCSSDYLL